MIYLGLIFKILFIHVVAVISPGPDFLVVTKNALNYSRKIGIWTAFGIACGISIHVSYTIGGIAIIISQNENIFNVIKYAGGIYLLYMAYQSFKSIKPRDITKIIPTVKLISNWKAFKIGFITNALNPKATLFFLGVFTAIIPADTPLSVLLTIMISIIIITGVWFVIVATLFTHKSIQRKYYSYESTINIVFGILLLCLALQILFF